MSEQPVAKPATRVLRYRGDQTKTLPAVLGGRFMVIESRYDADLDITLAELAPLIDPSKVLEARLAEADQ